MPASNRWGQISKQGNSLLRLLLVDAAQAAFRISPDWRADSDGGALRRALNLRRASKLARAARKSN